MRPPTCPDLREHQSRDHLTQQIAGGEHSEGAGEGRVGVMGVKTMRTRVKTSERERVVVAEAEDEAVDSSEDTDLDMLDEEEPVVLVTKPLTPLGMTSTNTMVETRREIAVVAAVEDVAVEDSVLEEDSVVVLGVVSGVDSEEASAGASVVDEAGVRAVVETETVVTEVLVVDTEVVEMEAEDVVAVSEEAKEDAEKAEAEAATAAVIKAKVTPRSSRRKSLRRKK